MSFVVAVTDYVFPSLEPEQRVLAPLGVGLRPAQCKSEEEIIELTRGADAVLNCYAKMTARVIEKLDRCKIIARYGIGVDNVDLAAATQGENSGDQCPRLLHRRSLRSCPRASSLACAADRRGRRAVKGSAWDVVCAGGIRRLRGQTLGLSVSARSPLPSRRRLSRWACACWRTIPIWSTAVIARIRRAGC